MKRLPLQLFATVCLPLFVLGCPEDVPGDDEVGDTDTSTDESTDDATTTDDEAESTTLDEAESTDESTDDATTTDESTDESTDDATTTDESTDESTDDATETATETGGVCGDMIIEGSEECEADDLAGNDCISLGFAGGDLQCGGDCLFDTSACLANAECGNGVVEGDEACDLDDLGGQTCVDLGFAAGELTCADDCTLIADACTSCGNDVIDDGETCDGADLGGQTCAGLGFAGGGELVCGNDCAPDAGACVGPLLLCNDTVTPIPDNDLVGVTIPIVVPAMGAIVDIDISVDITHTWLADLDVTLDQDGMGSTAMFHDIGNIGGGAGGCSGNNMLATLDDAAATSIQTQACTNANVPAVNGTHQPELPLSGFNGSNAAGTWNLVVADDAGADLGSVNQWCVSITFE